MNIHRYKLASNKVPKLDCPYCGAKKHWQRYIDTETGEVLPEHYGRCDNESKCGKWNIPKDYKPVDLYRNSLGTNDTGIKKPKKKKAVSFIPVEVLKQTLTGYEKNVFIQNLLARVNFPFEVSDIEKVISLYRLGMVQHGYRAGAITFPFIDINGNVRAVQVKQFDETNHTISTDFLHSIIEKHCTRNNKPLPEWLEAYNKNDTKVSCLFGEHLLGKYPSNPVALVEAPKTAIYGTLYFGLPETPESLIWLAVYNKSSFSFDKSKVLRGRNVFVFPDLSKDGSTFREWETKAKEYGKRLPGTRFVFSDLLEQLAPDQDKGHGNDLADVLIKQDWRFFRKSDIKEQPPQPEPEKSEAPKTKIFSHVAPFQTEWAEQPIKEQPKNWGKDISELKTYFDNIELPIEPIKLNDWTTIINTSKFVASHFTALNTHNGNPYFVHNLNRLKELKRILTVNPN